MFAMFCLPTLHSRMPKMTLWGPVYVKFEFPGFPRSADLAQGPVVVVVAVAVAVAALIAVVFLFVFDIPLKF